MKVRQWPGSRLSAKPNQANMEIPLNLKTAYNLYFTAYRMSIHTSVIGPRDAPSLRVSDCRLPKRNRRNSSRAVRLSHANGSAFVYSWKLG